MYVSINKTFTHKNSQNTRMCIKQINDSSTPQIIAFSQVMVRMESGRLRSELVQSRLREVHAFQLGIIDGTEEFCHLLLMKRNPREA